MTVALGDRITPTGILVAPPTDSHADFVAARTALGRERVGIGSSDVPAILGMDKYRSPIAVYLEMAGELPDLPRTEALQDAAEMGLIYEDGIARLLGRRKGFAILASPGTLAHVDRPWAMTNVDRFADESGDGTADAPIECKNRSAYQLADWDDEDPPDAVALQTHWHMAVTGYDHAWVAGIVGGNTPRFFRLERDEGLIEHLFSITEAFRQGVINQQMPPVDASEVTADLLAHLYDVQPDATVGLPDSAIPWLEQLRRAKDAKDVAEQDEVEAKNHLKSMLGAGELGLLGEGLAVTWKRNGTLRMEDLTHAHPDVVDKFMVDQPTFDLDAFKAAEPELYAAYRARVFRRTGAWK